ncbi:MAG TPA: PASTA domain-containing protein [Gemmatimonadales bacterium]
MAGRRLLRQAAVVSGTFLLAYLITILWLFPAPLFSHEHAVPRVLDLGATEAREKLESQGFRMRVEDQQTDPSVPRGAVVWQDPPPGMVLTPNSQVSIILSDGPPDVPVPDVGGFPRLLAERVLKAAGFTLGKPDTLPALSEPGTVVQTRPPPGIGRPAGSEVGLVLSSGPAELSVPGVLGLPLAQARERIEVLGLIVGTTTGRVVAGRPEGIVIDQRPSAGTRSPKGARVDLVVTKKGL